MAGNFTPGWLLQIDADHSEVRLTSCCCLAAGRCSGRVRYMKHRTKLKSLKPRCWEESTPNIGFTATTTSLVVTSDLSRPYAWGREADPPSSPATASFTHILGPRGRRRVPTRPAEPAATGAWLGLTLRLNTCSSRSRRAQTAGRGRAELGTKRLSSSSKRGSTRGSRPSEGPLLQIHLHLVPLTHRLPDPGSSGACSDTSAQTKPLRILLKAAASFRVRDL